MNAHPPEGKSPLRLAAEGLRFDRRERREILRSVEEAAAACEA